MSESIVQTQEGLLRGFEGKSRRGKTIHRFLGVPYAEPPIGELRFKSPVPVKPWSGIKDALKEKPPCSQIERDPGPILPSHNVEEGKVFDSPTGKMINSVFNGEEDCLYLNIHTPKLPNGNQSNLLPVMVYIHGGGFVSGSSSALFFGGDLLVEKDVVFVSIAYRLGVVGFLCLDTPQVPGNAGLRDQMLALSWIKRNIKSFNGDPNNITAFGISAGSASVEYQMLSPLSKGLFNKAILQAGSCLNPWAFTKSSEQHNKKLLEKLGIKNVQDVLKSLQSVDVKTLVKAANEILDAEDVSHGEIFAFVPTVEKSFEGVEPFLIKSPLELLKSGEFNTDVTVISGFSTTEGNFFKDCFEKDMKNELLDKYYKNEKDPTGEFLSDLLFLEGMHIGIEQRMMKSVPQFVYMISYEGDMGFYMKMVTGKNCKECGHGFDMLYLSENIYIIEDNINEKDMKIRQLFLKLWTDFAKHGNPTPNALEGGFVWKKYTRDQQKIMEIAENCSMIDNPFAKRIKLVEGKLRNNY